MLGPWPMKCILSALLIASVALGLELQAEESSPMQQVHTIPLPNIEGRIDHFSVIFDARSTRATPMTWTFLRFSRFCWKSPESSRNTKGTELRGDCRLFLNIRVTPAA